MDSNEDNGIMKGAGRYQPHPATGRIIGAIMAGALAAATAGRCVETEEPDPTAQDLDRKRGCMVIREINWAGSVDNEGNYDPDDDFLEMQNRDCNKAVDLTGWMLVIEGDFVRTHLIPEAPEGKSNIVQPNQFVVLISREKAFRARPSDDPNENYEPILVEEMIFPNRSFSIETRTAENFLIENAANDPNGEPFAGGYDGYTVRSMERTEDTFDEEGSQTSSWHSMTPCNEMPPSAGGTLMGTGCGASSADCSGIGCSGVNVDPNYSQRTFASPGKPNTATYE